MVSPSVVMRILWRFRKSSGSWKSMHLTTEAAGSMCISMRSVWSETLRNTTIMAIKEIWFIKPWECLWTGGTNGASQWTRGFGGVKIRENQEAWRQWNGSGYNGRAAETKDYDDSRYHCLNLHSVFQKELWNFRLFNGRFMRQDTPISSFVWRLAPKRWISPAGRRKTQTSNEKYTFRTWLLRLGLNGEEFATARQHLLANLPGCIAWRIRLRRKQHKRKECDRKWEKELAERDQRQGNHSSNWGIRISAGEAQESRLLYANDRRKQIERKTKTLYCLWEQSESGADGISLSDCEGSRKKSELKDYELLFQGRP